MTAKWIDDIQNIMSNAIFVHVNDSSSCSLIKDYFSI